MGKKVVSNDEPTRGTVVRGKAMLLFENGPLTDELQDDMRRAQAEGYRIHTVATFNTDSGLITVVVASKPAPIEASVEAGA